MANIALAGKAVAKQEQILNQYFPGWKDEAWKHTREEPGYTPVPRTLSLISVLIKELRKDKRHDPSIVYMDLWFRAFNGLVDVRDEQGFAYSCGFTASRGMRSWRERIEWLEKQGFIRAAKRYGNSIGYIFLRNPDMVVLKLDQEGRLPSNWKNVYEMKMYDIKAKRWEPPKEDGLKKKVKGSSRSGTVASAPKKPVIVLAG